MALIATARFLISIGVHHGLPIVHMDIPQAFIQAYLDREIWMDLPEGIRLKPDFIKQLEKDQFAIFCSPRRLRQWTDFVLTRRRRCRPLSFVPNAAAL